MMIWREIYSFRAIKLVLGELMPKIWCQIMGWTSIDVLKIHRSEVEVTKPERGTRLGWWQSEWSRVCIKAGGLATLLAIDSLITQPISGRQARAWYCFYFWAEKSDRNPSEPGCEHSLRCLVFEPWSFFLARVHCCMPRAEMNFKWFLCFELLVFHWIKIVPPRDFCIRARTHDYTGNRRCEAEIYCTFDWYNRSSYTC